MRFFILFLLTTSLFSKVVITEKFDSYPINVYSAPELVEEVLNSPLMHNNQLAIAQAHGKFRKIYYYGKKSNVTCKPIRVLIELDITYTMPKMINTHTEGQVDIVWDKWYPHILKHEKTHGKYYIQTAYAIENRITSLKKFRNCKTLKKEVNKIINEEITEMKRVNKEFDSIRHKNTDIRTYFKK